MCTVCVHACVCALGRELQTYPWYTVIILLSYCNVPRLATNTAVAIVCHKDLMNFFPFCSVGFISIVCTERPQVHVHLWYLHVVYLGTQLPFSV